MICSRPHCQSICLYKHQGVYTIIITVTCLLLHGRFDLCPVDGITVGKLMYMRPIYGLKILLLAWFDRWFKKYWQNWFGWTRDWRMTESCTDVGFVNHKIAGFVQPFCKQLYFIISMYIGLLYIQLCSHRGYHMIKPVIFAGWQLVFS